MQIRTEKCYYCGSTLNQNNYTEDHFPGRLVLPHRGKSMPVKWRPCCFECNQSIKKDEEYFWSRLVNSAEYEETEPFDRFWCGIKREAARSSLRGFTSDIVELPHLPEPFKAGMVVDGVRMDVVLQKFGRALVSNFFDESNSWQHTFKGEFLSSQLHTREDLKATSERLGAILGFLEGRIENGTASSQVYNLITPSGKTAFQSKIRRLHFFDKPTHVVYIFFMRLSGMIGYGLSLNNGTLKDIERLIASK